MRSPTILAGALAVGFALACGQPSSGDGRDVSGNFEVLYADDLQVYINDELVADVLAGENPSITWNGQSFDIEALCGDEGTTCPSEAYWSRMGVEQPLGTDNGLLNFVSLDAGTAGDRVVGALEADGRFTMLTGLAADGNGACAAVGIGSVKGRFTEANDEIVDAVLAVEWGAGCQFGEAQITGTLRLETTVAAARTGPLDLAEVQ